MPHASPTGDPTVLDDDALRGYLAETLAPEAMAKVEKALRESASLRDRLEDVRQDRSDPGLHTLGAIWRRGRLTCATRQQWGSYLLEALDPEYAEYLTFHLEVVECPYCLANLADIQEKADAGVPASRTRQKRYFQTSRHLLSSDG